MPSFIISPFRRWSLPASSKIGRCCRRSSICPVPTNCRPAVSNLPWAPDRDFAVGEFARNQGSQVPTRLVASAKSWLCHPGIDRRAAGAAVEGAGRLAARCRRWKPARSTSSTLSRRGTPRWREDVAENRLEQQDVILTVPASFDAVARELTVEAARAAGLEHVTLLEEPQAAFYAWIDASGDAWRKQVEVGDAVLICDVGGGTTDLTLIAVGEEDGQPGPDARGGRRSHPAGRRQHGPGPGPRRWPQAFAAKGIKLDAGQMLMLWHSCRCRQGKALQRSVAEQHAGDGAGPRQPGHRRHAQGRTDAGRGRARADRGLLPRLPAGRRAAPAAKRSACRNWACPTPAIRP